MIILGVDPGLRITGYGVIEVSRYAVKCRDCGGIYNRDTSEPLSAKLQTIYDGIADVIRKHQPQHFAIEDVFYHENVKTAIVMGHARGVAMLAAQQQDIPVHEYAAREIKMSTVGTGAASKQQVQAMVKNLLGMRELPKPQDAADALAAALCHYHRIKFRMLSRAKR